MWRVKNWAHAAAHNHSLWADEDEKNDYNTANIAAIDEERQTEGTNGVAATKVSRVRQLGGSLRVIFIDHNKWLNPLLVFAPVGVAVAAAGVNKNIVFGINAVAIIPLAATLTLATESLAQRTSPTIGALLNVSFGNSVELIIFIIALMKNEIRVVQASLVGSILANLLLILGMSMAVGGLTYAEQIYDSVVTQMSSSLLVLSVLSLLIPTVFHASFNDQKLADAAVVKISRGTAIILLIIYLLYLTFQLKSHAYLYEGTPQHIIDEQTQPGILQRMNSTGSSTSSHASNSSSIPSVSSGNSGGLKRRIKKKAKAKLGRRRSTRTEEAMMEEEEEKKISPDGPAPLASDAVGPSQKATTLGNQQAVSDHDPTPVATQTSGNKINNSGTGRRPFPMARGITIRAPPVFRTESQAGQNPHQARYRYPANQLRRYNSAPSMPSAAASAARQPPKSFTAPLRTASGFSNHHGNQLAPVESQKGEPPLGLKTSVVLLLASTALVAVCAEFMVGAIQNLVQTSPLSEAFIGLILLPIVGNAAEHVTAVVVAAKNQMDLALSVALGSSIQIALFITPLVVLIGWIAEKQMSLYFTLFETVALFSSVFIVCFLCLDGRSNYLEGSLLCGAYVIIAVAAYLFPDSENVNSFAGGTGGRT